MTSEQLEASRAERLRQNGHGALTLEDARTWIEETGLCLFLPRRQFSSSIAPSFVEAIIGERNTTPDPKQIQVAEELLVRLETDGVAVRLNLLGLPGEDPDFVVASWVLPYVYALRGDRDWRRSPQLTGSRQVSPLAVQAYKLLEAGDATIADLTRTLGREVTETAVLRAITELWQQLRIIPVIAAPGESAKWQLLRTRYQKAIAEGASTSQVTAISVLASIYLQAVIAASMEDVEIFLAPLTARSKVREVLRGLVATRQVHTLSLGHAPQFYVAGTLPEFDTPSTAYSSSSMPASAYFTRQDESEEDMAEVDASQPVLAGSTQPRGAAESYAPHASAGHRPATSGNTVSARSHFSWSAPHAHDRKPAQTASGSCPARRASSDSRPATALATKSARSSSAARWSPKASLGTNGKRSGTHSSAGSVVGARSTSGAATRSARSSSGNSSAKSSSSAWSQRSGHSNGAKPVDQTSDSQAVSRTSVLAAGVKAGNGNGFGFAARPKQETKKRG